MAEECPHDDLEFLGEQKGEVAANKYFRCRKCGGVLVASEKGDLYYIPPAKREGR